MFQKQQEFDILKAYSKEICETKKEFVSQVNLSTYKYLVRLLGFEVYSKANDYKFGKKYFSDSENDFKWATTNPDKKLNITYWDSKNHTTNSKEIIPWLRDDDYETHYKGACQKKTRYNISKKKGSVFYQKREVMDTFSEALININKISNKTFGCAQKEKSNILWLDIDNRNSFIATSVLQEALDALCLTKEDIMFMEQNIISGGLHVFIKFKNNISAEEFKKLEEKLNSQLIRVECVFKNKVLRLPISYEYMPIKIDKDLNLNSEFISSDHYMKTESDLIQTINKFSLSQPIDNIKITNYLNGKNEQSVKKEDKWKNYWSPSNRKVLFKRDVPEMNERKILFPSIKMGDRWNSTKKLVPLCKSMGLSLYDTAGKIKELNESSKDLMMWSQDDVAKNIKSFYNKCNGEITSTIKYNPDYFVSNEKYLDDYMLSIIDNDKIIDEIVNRLDYHYTTVRNKHSLVMKSLSDEKKAILKLQLPLMLKEICGKMIYDIKTNKSFIDKKYDKMIGFQLSDAHLIKIQDEVNVKLNLVDHPLAKTNIQYLKKSIILSLGLDEIQSNCKNKRNWIKGSCKSYNIKTMTDVYRLFQHLLNLIKSVLISFNQFIYNISIGVNDQNSLDNSKIIDKPPIPIPIST
jgi:hypothetical protein